MLTERTTTAREALDVDDVRRAFRDGSGNAFLHYEAFDLEAVKARIQADGYAIVKDLIPRDTLQAIRAFWVTRFQHPGALQRVTWGPYLGQPNMIGFTNDAFQCLYRSCDFLWNEPYDRATRELGIRLNGLRNLIQGFELFRGLTFSSDRYGVFVTTSYYPPGEGRLGFHTDGVLSDTPLVHHIVPLTIKGEDYQDGGLVLVDRAGRTIDVDGAMPCGSALFYNAALKHGVHPIVPFPGRSLGRMQLFAIPTTFTNIEQNRYALERIPVKNFLQAKALKLKNKALVALGFSQIIR